MNVLFFSCISKKKFSEKEKLENVSKGVRKKNSIFAGDFFFLEMDLLEGYVTLGAIVVGFALFWCMISRQETEKPIPDAE